MTNAQGITKEEIESQAIVMDKDGRHLANVRACFWPKLHCGGFQLPSSVDVHQILTTASNLQTSDDRLPRLLAIQAVRLCTAFHPMSPDKHHLEFDYEPIA